MTLIMKKLIKYFRDKPHILLLIVILLLGTFFRTYQIVDRFAFAHDGDLYSWIVKDILVNKHFRLVGQETSASGIFIGSFFYYLIAPFFLLTNMDPIGAVIPITAIGILTILSYYIVFSKLFNVTIGLMASFLYATLIATILSDRWVVPSTLTNLWVIWYFYTVVMLSRGNFIVLPIAGILIGLIWHIHIALLPSLIALPLAVFLSKKFPTAKQILIFLMVLFITSLPLLIFEIKNGFPQSASFIQKFLSPNLGGATGIYKFQKVMQMIAKNINNLFFAPQSFNFTNNIFFVIALLLSALLLIKRKLIALKELLPLYAWILGVVLFFSLTSSPVSEYYFSNIEVIFLMFVSILFYFLFQSSNLGKKVALGIFIIILFKNAFYFININQYQKGYAEKKAVVNFIVEDARLRNFPCFSINYITSPGENVGFRYFFYLKSAKLSVAGNGSPVYSIVIPDEYAKDEVEKRFGHIGIITPKKVATMQVLDYACSGLNTNLTDPMLGFVE